MQNELDKYKDCERTKQYQLEQINKKYKDNLQQLSTQQHNNQLLTNQNQAIQAQLQAANQKLDKFKPQKQQIIQRNPRKFKFENTTFSDQD